MTRQPNTATPDSIGQVYDEFTGIGATAVLGGNIHVGYWDDDHDVPIAEATDRITDLVAQRLAPRPDAHLLDVGCGNGFPAVRIARAHDVRVTGITVSRQQVAQAQELAADAGGRASFLFADAMHLPFDDGSFDGAWAIEALMHMTEQTRALSELHRVVRPGGRLVVTDLCQRQPFTGEDRALLDGMLRAYEIVDISTPGEHRARLAEAGWELLEMTDIGERVRPSYGHAAAAFRELATSLDAGAAEQITAAADAMEAFGKHPDTGYVVITARRS
ncbi:methyltransferase domain-containing protein [Streptomyces purpureus]|uniref:Methyltransferase type 11 n=1 Tax=Streptomyces purpureus TaxID=1951 RepID=A0A918GWG2_9ACTN|nr:methyltransferase domain-containing protein [Streptomyces purpureus]GGT13861.1 methyltransferase type 11 [Streptomyces purpureus]